MNHFYDDADGWGADDEQDGVDAPGSDGDGEVDRGGVCPTDAPQWHGGGVGHGGETRPSSRVHDPTRFLGTKIMGGLARPLALPPVIIVGADGTPRPAPFLMTLEDVADLFRLRESGSPFPCRTIRRYRRLGLRSVRVGRRVFIRLDDALAFLNAQQDRISGEERKRG